MSIRDDARLFLDLFQEVLRTWVLIAFGMYITIAILGVAGGSGFGSLVTVPLLVFSCGFSFLSAVIVAIETTARPIWPIGGEE